MRKIKDWIKARRVAKKFGIKYKEWKVDWV
jgi:hypothetical protein